MKHSVRLLVVLGLLSLGVPQVYANCFYPFSSTVSCYQRGPCYPPAPGERFGICLDSFYVVGECTTDCNGNTTCWGTNQNCAYTEHDLSTCPMICE